MVNDGSEPVPEGRGELDEIFTSSRIRRLTILRWKTLIRPETRSDAGYLRADWFRQKYLLSLIQRHFDVSEGDIRFHVFL